MQSLGERLAQARRQLSVHTRADVSPSDVAAAIKVAPATVYRWETNEKSPSEENLAKLAAFLGVTPAYLRYGVTPHIPTREELDALSHDEQQAILRAAIRPSAKTLVDAEGLARLSQARDEADDRALAREQAKRKAAGHRRR